VAFVMALASLSRPSDVAITELLTCIAVEVGIPPFGQ